MAESIANATLRLNANYQLRNTLTDTTKTATVDLGGALLNLTLTDGNGQNQANRAWERKSVTILSGQTADIDLYDFAGIDIGGGSGKDALGQSMALEEIVFFCLIAESTSVGSLELMPANPANYWACAPALTAALGNALKAGGMLMMLQPNHQAFDVYDASSHVIRLGANGGNCVYSLYIVGRSADSYS